MNNNDSIMWQEIFEQPEVIRQTLSTNSPKLREIAQAVRKRQLTTVMLAGRGSSEHACQVARYLFEANCGLRAEIAAPSVITRYAGKLDLHDVLTIGVSQSGGAQDVYEFMQATEKQGGLCVSITNEADSIMAKTGDYRIDLGCGPEKSITAAKSYMAELTILTALAAYLAQDKELINVIDAAPEIIADTLELQDQIGRLVPYVRNTPQLLIIARGLLYGLALETELKIQETCYLDARAYAASDYQHGPIATTNRFTPVLFFIADPHTDLEVIALHKRLKQEHNIFSMVVTAGQKIENADITITFPHPYQGLAAVFAGAVFSQMFACLLSLARGYDPDHPVGVSKHTITR